MENKIKPATSSKSYTKPIDISSADKYKASAPIAMAELEIMKTESGESLISHNTAVRTAALLLLAIVGISLVSQFVSLAMTKSFNGTDGNILIEFVKANGMMGIGLLVVQLVAVLTLLFTRNSSIAKTIILVAGISLLISIFRGMVNFRISPTMLLDLAALALDFFIFRKIYDAYMSL